MSEKFSETWNSLVNHKTPEWFREAKFGIYTHWGPYCVPTEGPKGANGTWYPHNMYKDGTEQQKYHWKTYGKDFGYKDFIPQFTGEKFNAEEWAEMFKQSGAQFAGPVAEHHDGFAMWDTDLTKWNSVNMGPKRDVVAELEKAIKSRGMKFLTTFHHSFNWWFFPSWRKEYDCSNPEYKGLYPGPHAEDAQPDKEYLDMWRDKILEVVDKFQPDMLWFDFGLGKIQDKYKKEMLAYYYNKEQEWGKDVLVAYKEFPGKNYNLPPGAGIYDLEVGKMNNMTPFEWLSDTSVDARPLGTWSHVAGVGFKSVERLVHNLVDRVSKNGYLLLNIGPRADGSIPLGAQECLQGIGKWLKVNGEAIYGTTPWSMFGEGPTNQDGGGHFNETNEPRFTSEDFRFTIKDNTLYIICLGRPGDQVHIKTLSSLYESEINSIGMLGTNEKLGWKIDPDAGLIIDVPEKMPCDHAVTFKVNLKGAQ